MCVQVIHSTERLFVHTPCCVLLAHILADILLNLLVKHCLESSYMTFSNGEVSGVTACEYRQHCFSRGWYITVSL